MRTLSSTSLLPIHGQRLSSESLDRSAAGAHQYSSGGKSNRSPINAESMASRQNQANSRITGTELNIIAANPAPRTIVVATTAIPTELTLCTIADRISDP
jgi:hypothetical protein